MQDNYCVLCGLSICMAWKIREELRADEEWQWTCANLDISEFENTSLTDTSSGSLYRLCESEDISVGFDFPAPSLTKLQSCTIRPCSDTSPLELGRTWGMITNMNSSLLIHESSCLEIRREWSQVWFKCTMISIPGGSKI